MENSTKCQYEINEAIRVLKWKAILYSGLVVWLLFIGMAIGTQI